MALEMSLRSGGSEGGGSTHQGAEDQEAEKLRKRVREAEHQIQQLQASNGSLQKRLEDESRFGDFDPPCTHIEQEQHNSAINPTTNLETAFREYPWTLPPPAKTRNLKRCLLSGWVFGCLPTTLCVPQHILDFLGGPQEQELARLRQELATLKQRPVVTNDDMSLQELSVARFEKVGVLDLRGSSQS